MREKELRYRSTICRLLTLLLIVLVGVGSAANQVNGASLGRVNSQISDETESSKSDNRIEKRSSPIHSILNFNKIIDIHKQGGGIDPPTGEITTQIRKHRLINLCNKKFVKIMKPGKKFIRADGAYDERSTNFSYLTFVSLPNGHINILSQSSGLYLCFNKRWKPTAVYDLKKKKNLRTCEWEEVYSEDREHTHYVAAGTRKQKRYLGFHKSGKALKGKDIKKLKNRSKKDCYTFKKVDLPRRESNVERCTPKPGRGPLEMNNCDRNNFENIFFDLNKIRRKRHHKKHRNG
ncbi:uncharacterized protein LOC128212300 isoform X2 [Mya arenaria]|uniref:uncharacterized protein LOC128212300 isoform X2 n=1 Tax=Mya arenaria TaxID=6604 RepID=UPI0022E64BD0|nr:uncharacterized protein LOC128212300 isoform X2 [Mya arenaria]